MQFNDDLNACAAEIERGDAIKFRAIMAAPVAARRVLFPLFAMNLEIARAPWASKEAMISEMRLQWWHDALGEIAAGGIVRRHYVVTPLAHLLSPVQAQRLQDLVAARRWDIYNDPFDDESAFFDYLTKTSGALYQTLAELLGERDPATALTTGTMIGLANYLTAIPALEQAGKRPLPDGRADAVQNLARRGLAELSTKGCKTSCLAGYRSRYILTHAARFPNMVATGLPDPNPLLDRLLLIQARIWVL